MGFSCGRTKDLKQLGQVIHAGNGFPLCHRIAVTNAAGKEWLLHDMGVWLVCCVSDAL